MQRGPGPSHRRADFLSSLLHAVDHFRAHGLGVGLREVAQKLVMDDCHEG
jgi:hypothetical protein